MNQQRPCSNQFRQTSGMLSGGGSYAPAIGIRQPPPVPPRRITSPHRSYGGYRPGFASPYGGSYNAYGSGGLGYGSYGGYGDYGSLYGNSYRGFSGPSGDVENKFIEFAEESSRPAFESVEAIVHTFSSITMMMESTLFAMTNSLRAVFGVAENIGRVRIMFTQLLSSFALIRFLKQLYRKIMFYFGLTTNYPNSDNIWQKTVLEVAKGEKTNPSAWPLVLLLSFLVGIPCIIQRLISQKSSQTQISPKDPKEWLKFKEPIYSATAAYDFIAATPEEITLKAGQKIWLAPKAAQPKNLPGWCMATDGLTTGLVPSNYVTIVGQIKKKIDTQTIGPPESPSNVKVDEYLDNYFVDSNDTHAETSQISLEET